MQHFMEIRSFEELRQYQRDFLELEADQKLLIRDDMVKFLALREYKPLHPLSSEACQQAIGSLAKHPVMQDQIDDLLNVSRQV